MVEDIQRAPRGQVNWSSYVTEKLPAMKFLDVPCRHPDLRNNKELTAAIHYVIRKQLASLESQRHAGIVVVELMEMCLTLLRFVEGVSPSRPTRKQLDGWFRSPLAANVFLDGLNAITWSTEETGLGGITDWRGLPWVMSMEQFYEAWVETAFSRFTRRFGGVLRVGRRRETITPIAWEHPFLGSQKYLMPDLVIEQEDRTIFIDAKYKDHWEALRQHRWLDLEEEIRKRHRDDLLQVLAYSTLSESKATTACLAYPCTLDTWTSLKERGTVSHKAAVYAGKRKIDLAMVAIPMGEKVDEIVDQLGSAYRSKELKSTPPQSRAAFSGRHSSGSSATSSAGDVLFPPEERSVLWIIPRVVREQNGSSVKINEIALPLEPVIQRRRYVPPAVGARTD